ncbi:MAG: L-seryl-tRNA(Sec) selenium transferase [Thermomicrobiales bacterium]|nr:L-seryl-tRNA(Sec) selenium transferase [Thermomicrobiales bacterium]
MTQPSRNDIPTSIEENPLRALPPVSAVLESLPEANLEAGVLAVVAREELACVRAEIEAGARLDREAILQRCRHAVEAIEDTRFDPVIDGTGIVLHTNLGRAPVSRATAEAMALAASSYVALEIDPQTNQRGGRMDEISRLMNLLTGAEATLVVNNNAGALLLTLAALGAGRSVVVSRGEAVEIGGGFRIPDVIAQSGCILTEVGTTNRTYAADYRRAVGESTAALLKVHTSNFRIEGFTSGVTSAELGEVARAAEIPLIEDLGSGALLDTAKYGLRHETTVAEAIGAGASVVTMSGDKLLGGPQAGIIAGQRQLVRQIERHPLARALRSDKTTLAGVATTLRHYLRGEAETDIPIWRMIGATVDDLDARARCIADPLELAVVPSVASIGGGSLPGETLPSRAIRIETPHPDEVTRALRTSKPRVFPYIRDGAVLVDVRTVLPEQDPDLMAALERALSRSTSE